VKRLVCLVLLVLAGACSAEVKITGEANVPAGKLARLDIDLGDLKLSEKGQVRWKVRGLTIDPTTNKIVVADLQTMGTKVVFTGPPGVYLVEVRALDFKAEFFEEAEREVTLAGGVLPIPPPEDLLGKAIFEAYAQEKAADKKNQCLLLGAAYRKANDIARLSSTAGELADKITAEREKTLPGDPLRLIRTAISKELAAVMPKKANEVLTDLQRQQAISIYTRAANALEKVP